MSTEVRDIESATAQELISPNKSESSFTKSAESACCSHNHHGFHDDDHNHNHNHNHNHGHDHDHSAPYLPTAVSLLLLLSAIALDYSDSSWFSGFLRIAWYSIAYILVGGKVLWQAAKNISKGDVFNEFLLMGIATIGAFYIGEYAEGVAVMLFYVIGEHFQEAAVIRSRKSIKELVDNRPEKVMVKRNGAFVETHPNLVAIGEIIQIKPGEKAALDGIMLTEASAFNTAALTGESKPDMKRKGEEVLAGMVNLDKTGEIRVTSVYEDSALSKILKLVEEAGSRKAKTQKFITRFAKVYTPIVVFLAVAIALLPYFFVETYVFNDWLYRALVFLVISCPCALVISIPLGYFGGISAASKNGLLFKGANFLDQITKLDTVVFDKTGTLTKGVFKVQKVEVEESLGIDENHFLALVSALESQSTHPVAKAITQYANLNYNELEVLNAEEIPGYGMRGTVDGMEILAGNAKLMSKFSVSYHKKLEDLTETIVMAAVNGTYAGHIAIADEVKEDAAEAVQALKKSGVDEIMMLSGDKSSVVKSLAATLNIDQAYGDLLPADKAAKVEELKQQGKTVAFVGDGINDAPVITLADVGIAMGGLGSDAAIETADVVIQTDKPSKIGTAISIGKKTKQIVWQNIAMAFGVKALVMTFGAFGVATLWEAVFADVGVALLAILNAVRIQRIF